MQWREHLVCWEGTGGAVGTLLGTELSPSGSIPLAVPIQLGQGVGAGPGASCSPQLWHEEGEAGEGNLKEWM